MEKRDYDENEVYKVHCNIDYSLRTLSKLCTSQVDMSLMEVSALLDLMSANMLSVAEQIESDYTELEAYRTADLKRQKKGKKGG